MSISRREFLIGAGMTGTVAAIDQLINPTSADAAPATQNGSNGVMDKRTMARLLDVSFFTLERNWERWIGQDHQEIPNGETPIIKEIRGGGNEQGKPNHHGLLLEIPMTAMKNASVVTALLIGENRQTHEVVSAEIPLSKSQIMAVQNGGSDTLSFFFLAPGPDLRGNVANFANVHSFHDVDSFKKDVEWKRASVFAAGVDPEKLADRMDARSHEPLYSTTYSASTPILGDDIFR